MTQIMVKVGQVAAKGTAIAKVGLEACNLVGRGYAPDEAMLRADGGKLLGLTRVVAQVR